MPPDLPDHYSTNAAPRKSLSDMLGLTKPSTAPLPPIARRF